MRNPIRIPYGIPSNTETITIFRLRLHFLHLHTPILPLCVILAPRPNHRTPAPRPTPTKPPITAHSGLRTGIAPEVACAPAEDVDDDADR